MDTEYLIPRSLSKIPLVFTGLRGSSLSLDKTNVGKAVSRVHGELPCRDPGKSPLTLALSPKGRWFFIAGLEGAHGGSCRSGRETL
jgi:hypothetical protein